MDDARHAWLEASCLPASDLHNGDERQAPLTVLLGAISCDRFPLFSSTGPLFHSESSVAPDGQNSSCVALSLMEMRDRFCHNNHTEMIFSVDSNTSAQLGEIFPELYDTDKLRDVTCDRLRFCCPLLVSSSHGCDVTTGVFLVTHQTCNR